MPPTNLNHTDAPYRFLALRELVDQVEERVSPATSKRLKDAEKKRKQKARRRRRSKSSPPDDAT